MPSRIRCLKGIIHRLSGGNLFSLRAKWTVFLTLYIAVSFAVLSGVIIRLERDRALNQEKDQAIASLQALAKVIYGKWNPQATSRENIAAMESTGIRVRLYEEPLIVYAAFQDADGNLRYVPKRNPSFSWMVERTRSNFLTERNLAVMGSATRSFYERPQGKVTEFLARVTAKSGAPLGTVRLGFHDPRVNPSWRGYAHTNGGRLFFINLLATAAAFVLISFIASRLESPIRLLHRQARDLLSGAPASAPAEPSGDVLKLLSREMEGIEKLVDRLKQNRAELATTLSHEFRSPMQAIIGYVDFLRRGGAGAVSSEMDRYLMTIGDNAERFQSFIDNVLELARIDNGRSISVVRPFRPQKVVENVVHLYRERARVQGVQLLQEPGPDLRGVMGDPNRIFQVLINLISNALKFTPHGGQIRVGTIDRAQDAEFFVSDTGIGIPKEQHDRVFEEFYQVPGQPPARGPKGLGLGLTLCRRLLEAQGGRIWIEGETGLGTTVRFALPHAR